MSKKQQLVISGSVSLQDRMYFWKEHFAERGYTITAFPNVSQHKTDFTQQLTDIYTDFYRALDTADVFFLANEDKNNICGYVGANSTAELLYATMLRVVHGKDITIYILKIPDKSVLAYDEIMSFLRVGWIQIYSPSRAGVV